MKKLAIIFVKFYQYLISPIMSKGACRFHPSCSNYMIEAIEKKGFVKGSALGLWRILRCNPLCKGGSDPVK